MNEFIIIKYGGRITKKKFFDNIKFIIDSDPFTSKNPFSCLWRNGFWIVKIIIISNKNNQLGRT